LGYLEELKRQADDVLAQQRQDIGALQRNALLTDAACNATARYLATLSRQLEVLQPVSNTIWRFDQRTSFSQLRFSDFRTDSRMKKLRDAEVYDHVVLNFAAKTGTRVTSPRLPPEIEKLERACASAAALRQRSDPPGTGRSSALHRSPTSGRTASCPTHDSGYVPPHRQPRRFETVSVVFPAFEVGTARLTIWRAGSPAARRIPARRPAHSPRPGLTPGSRGERRQLDFIFCAASPAALLKPYTSDVTTSSKVK
jgi:hypothetical protein